MTIKIKNAQHESCREQQDDPIGKGIFKRSIIGVKFKIIGLKYHKYKHNIEEL
jgi:hypothetical protein